MKARTRSALSAQIFAIMLRPELSQAQRRRFWRGMRTALRRRSLVLGQRAGLCLVLAVGHRIGYADRRHVVDWLLDQPQTHRVIVNPQLSFEQIFSPTLAVNVEGMDLAPDDAQRLRGHVQSVLGRALCHYQVVVRQADRLIGELGHG